MTWGEATDALKYLLHNPPTHSLVRSYLEGRYGVRMAPAVDVEPESQNDEQARLKQMQDMWAQVNTAPREDNDNG